MRLQERRVKEDGKGGRRVGESILLDSCPSPREQEAETQLDRIDEEIPKNSALNFQRSLKHKRELTLNLSEEALEFTQFLANHNEDFFSQLLLTKEKPGCGNFGCTCRWQFSSFGNAALE